MGMFDYIQCDYPLPDGFDPVAHKAQFRTNDTDEQYLVTYTITADGRLVGPDGTDHNSHGTINFYASNWGSVGGSGFITRDDEEPWAVDYTAKFTDGKVVEIAGGDVTAEMFTGKHFRGPGRFKEMDAACANAEGLIRNGNVEAD